MLLSKLKIYKIVILKILNNQINYFQNIYNELIENNKLY